ncbi:MAG: hypothetical protein QM679_06660 [Patulibacter sp.]
MQSVVVRFKTTGTQRYIFASPRLREQMGGSELVAKLGDWTEQACRDATGHDEVNAEPLIAASGIATVIVTAPDGDAAERAAEQIITEVTTSALCDAPGLELRVSRSAAADPRCTPLWEQTQADAPADTPLPPALRRFQRNPLTEPCASSDYAATRQVSVSKDTRRWLSPPTYKQFNAGDEARIRLNADFGQELGAFPTIDKLEHAIGHLRWAACVHIDINGLGDLFGGIHRAVLDVLADWDEDLDPIRANVRQARQGGDAIEAEAADAALRDWYIRPSEIADDSATNAELASALYAAVLQRLSRLVDQLMTQAVRDAKPDGGSDNDERLPIVPLILGGDDLTLYTEGRLGLDAAVAILKGLPDLTRNAFQQECDEVPSSLTDALPGVDAEFLAELWQGVWKGAVLGKTPNGLGACAGVAIIKPHFPMLAAYRLAEDLTASAKAIKKIDVSACALDFHVHYDSVGGDLHAIRDRLGVDRFARPYAIGTPLANPTTPQVEWLERHCWDDLIAMRDAVVRAGVSTNSPGRRQFWAIREALGRDRETAETLFNAAVRQVGDQLHALSGPKWSASDGSQSLFWPDGPPPDAAATADDAPRPEATRALDVLDLAALERGA